MRLENDLRRRQFLKTLALLFCWPDIAQAKQKEEGNWSIYFRDNYGEQKLLIWKREGYRAEISIGNKMWSEWISVGTGFDPSLDYIEIPRDWYPEYSYLRVDWKKRLENDLCQ